MSKLKIGIVGSEGAKFTKKGRLVAKKEIAAILNSHPNPHLISGGCHLGGVDIWAEEIAEELDIPMTIFKPKHQSWSGGYRDRNIKIAQESDIVYVITVDRLPKRFQGMKFGKCYHCNTTKHVKSGGCWTGHRAQLIGKKVYWYIVEN